MITLGIETSCDETSCAILDGRDKILSNVISSSLFRHKPFGGVVPEIASRHSLEQIDFVFQHALKQAKCKAKDIKLIAVTKGPGLIGSLFVGLTFAKSLSYALKVPLVGVNHLEAHLVANFIGKRRPKEYIGLLVSGGHTSLYSYKKGKYRELGSTVDDAVGEAFDKVAKMMGLGYPGGPIIDRLAKEGNPEVFRFTRPKQKNRFDFSYSGIKTAVLYTVQKQKTVTEQFQKDMSAGFQNAAVSWLIEKALDAADHKKIRDIIVGGGVSANSLLRSELARQAEKRDKKVWFPPMQLTLDNAAMIARRGIELYRDGVRDNLRLTGNPNLTVV